jgi:hypothetical protein
MSVKSVQFTVAAHLMAALGFHNGEGIPSSTLAESENADPTFVRKSLSKLSKAGLIVTTRGKHGASALTRPPKQITLRQNFSSTRVPRLHNGPSPEGTRRGREDDGCQCFRSSGRRCQPWCTFAAREVANEVFSIHRQLGCSFCGLPIKQACVGFGHCHPNSMRFSRRHRCGNALTSVSLPLLWAPTERQFFERVDVRTFFCEAKFPSLRWMRRRSTRSKPQVSITHYGWSKAARQTRSGVDPPGNQYSQPS